MQWLSKLLCGVVLDHQPQKRDWSKKQTLRIPCERCGKLL